MRLPVSRCAPGTSSVISSSAWSSVCRHRWRISWIRISFVDSLHPDLCEAITGRVDSADQLKALQDATPIFVAGVDSDWLRIHPLAREFLRDRFEALPSDERRAAHGRAAHWLAGRQMYEAAARQALLAGQDQLAYEFAAVCLYDVLLSGQVATVSNGSSACRPPRSRSAWRSDGSWR